MGIKQNNKISHCQEYRDLADIEQVEYMCPTYSANW